MPGPAKVILVEADPAANAALRFGLSRAGLEVEAASTPSAVAEVAGSAGLVLISDGRNGEGGSSGSEGGRGSDGRVVVGGAELVEAVRSSLEDASLSTPILFIDGAKLGAGEVRGDEGPSDAQRSSRRAAERAGAWEVLQGPQALRDIANVARIMLCDRRNEGWAGNLLEISGVFGLVRALSALGRSGVLTLTRGVRRGEVRFFHGEITSAQVGMIHGQAAFHQLLLWTDAKFDFRGEIIVRRRQIPLTPQELLADAERFLESTRDIAGGLSPSVVLDVVADKLTALAIKIPAEVHAILNMFDGRRNLVDVLEDSPYRVHDTLRVARKGFETKVLKAVPPHKARPSWKAVASLEHWLLGEQPVVPREVRSTGVVTGIDDGETLKMEPELSGGVRASGVTSSGTVAALAAAAASGGMGYDVDVTERTPEPSGGNGSATVAVAVTVTSWRDLSALDWSELVPRSSGLEIPMLSPVVPAAKTKGEIDAVEVGEQAQAQAQVPASNGRSVIVSEDAIISPEERAEEERKIEARKQAERAALEADRKRVEEEIAAAAAEKKAAAEKAAAEAAEKAAVEKAAAEKAAAEKIAAEAAEKAAAEKAAAEKAAAETAEKAAAEKAAAEVAEKAAAEAAEKAAAEKAAIERAAAEAAAEKAAAEAAENAAAEKLAAEKAAAEKLAAETAAAAERAAAEKAAAEKAAAEKAAAETAAAEKAAIEKAAAEKASEEKATARLPAMSQTDEKTSKINRRPTTADVLPKNSKKRSKKGGRPATDSGASASLSTAAAASTATPSGSSGEAAGVGPAPRESQQDLSQTAKLGPQATPANPLAKHPRPSSSPVLSEEPSVLVADLQAAHTAVSALAKAQAAAASSPDAGGNFDAVVQQVKTDASKATAAFTADEEAFFQAGGHASNVETFADLDAGYRPRTFWQRLLGRGKTNH